MKTEPKRTKKASDIGDENDIMGSKAQLKLIIIRELSAASGF